MPIEYYTQENTETHKKNRYDELSGERDLFGYRAQQYAAWTLPGTFPRKDQVFVETEIQHDFQSTGAQGVINLANKLAMTLFHPSKSFFKLELPKEELKKLPNFKGADIDTALAEIERLVMGKFNTHNHRGKIIEVLQLLIMTGDCVLKMTEDSGIVVYHLHEYVRQLSVDGSLNLLIIKERKLPRNLPEAIKKKLKTQSKSYSDDSVIPLILYTIIERIENSDMYLMWQELENYGKITTKDGKYHVDDLPYINVWWQRNGRDNYGRGLVEALAGEFAQLSNVSESIAELTVVLANIIFLVKPGCQTDVKTLNDAESGEYVQGEPDDITCFSADLKIQIDSLVEQQGRLERKLGSAFLLHTAVTRDAERVTAEEIRLQAAELESTLGGIYTNLSFLLQYPIARKLLNNLDPAYKKLKVTILTGLEALSRFSDLENWKRLIMDLANMNNIPPAAAAWIKYGDLIKILAVGYALDYTKVLKTQEEFERDQAEAMKQQQEHEAILEQNKQQAKGD